MKFRKFAAKMFLVILAVGCCCFAKASAKDEVLYGSCLRGTVTPLDDGTVAIVASVDTNLIFNSRDKRSCKRTVDSAFRHIREQCKKPVSRITIEGITYSFSLETREIVVDGAPGCSPVANKSALDVLAIMPIFEVESHKVQRWSLEKGWHMVDILTLKATEPTSEVNRVVIRGNVRVIPRSFLALDVSEEGGGKIDYDGSIRPQTIDLGESSVDRICREAFFVPVSKIILPKHPVNVLVRLGRDGDEIEIENAEYANYISPNYMSSNDDDLEEVGCCLLL
ncbi:MAG: hypothetical protein LBR79_01115 [Oscillospiraceae bacterium]|nr:hypothetical protein [Oscillospiraceae bacterium]